MRVWMKGSRGARRHTSTPPNSARSHSEDQIRSGSRGGLLVGSMGSVVAWRIGWRSVEASAERRVARWGDGFQRTSIATVPSRPTQEKVAATVSSVSLTGTTPLSQRSHNSSNGVSAANRRTAAIASWRVRRTTLLRIDASGANLQFRRMTFLSCAILGLSKQIDSIRDRWAKPCALQ